jgi:hypothetical protein
MENKTKNNSKKLSVSNLKKSILAIQKPQSIEEQIFACKDEINQKHLDGVPLKIILKAIRAAGFVGATLTMLEALVCPQIEPNEPDLSNIYTPQRKDSV